MDTIEILGDQEETLGTAEDLREEISVEAVQYEAVGTHIKIEFETSKGLCTGYYFSNELGHEELTMEADSVIILTSLFPNYYATYINALNRDWVDIAFSIQYSACPEYKIYSRAVVL